MSYAGPIDMLARFDSRTLGDLCGDNNVRIQSSALPTDPNLQTALDDASGDIDGALLQGQRYAPSDLDSITGNSLNLLKRVTCDIAFGYLWDRRQWTASDREEEHAVAKRGRASLERLRKGENVFNLSGPLDAGIPNNTGPSSIELSQLRILTERTQNYYPVNELPSLR